MTISTSDALKHSIKAQAHAVGFDACGFASVQDAWPAGGRLEEFVALDRHGAMAWMAATTQRRSHPQAMWPQARSAIVLGLNYGPDQDPLAALEAKTRAAISVYAQGDDYHDLIKKKLKALAGWLAADARCQVKVFVDTAPLMEKPLAEKAGLGWQGKHTNLVSREFGSWLFLGVVLTDLELDPDPPSDEHCGACRACLDICPTDAFPAPFQLDARACLSYLTIEHPGPIPERYRAAMGNRIYGCDDCLAVCPWNKFAQNAREQALHARDSLKSPTLADLAALDDTAFRSLFAKSPVKRIGRNRFVRNVLYALGNSADPGAVQAVRPLLADPASEVRGAAVWALKQLMDEAAFAALAAKQTERDDSVLAEWRGTPA